jgi:hypothetical protein
MSKFKIGERVVFYSSGQRNIGILNRFLRHQVYEVKFGEPVEIYTTIHEKQIRRLVKKKKEKLGRELWFCKQLDSDFFYKREVKPALNSNVIHCREILDE